ncbi:MAG TPA: hypothetical protein VMS21_12835, partial [Methylomirabilota bacterium]|nr:hypothetical protein [Methylomirabilota bacterium]
MIGGSACGWAITTQRLPTLPKCRDQHRLQSGTGYGRMGAMSSSLKLISTDFDGTFFSEFDQPP